MNSARTARLNKILDTVCRGQSTIHKNNHLLFLESIYAQQDHVAVLSKITYSSHGLPAIQNAMRLDLSPVFFNAEASKFLEFIQHQDIQVIGNGSFLATLVKNVVEPPLFWQPFAQAFLSGHLHEQGQKAVAWLFLQVIQFPEDSLCRTAVNETALVDSINSSIHPSVKLIGQQIKRILHPSEDIVIVVGQRGPGGRHSNDYANFRQIAIVPTSDEIASTDPPYLRSVAILAEALATSGAEDAYLDNTFRMLREDMLHDMREELQLAQKKKGGKQRAVVLQGLKLLDVYFQDESGKKKFKWNVQLQCQKELWGMEKLNKPKERLDYLEQHRRLLKDRSLVTLLADDSPFAFATIRRDEGLLIKRPPVVVLELAVPNGPIFCAAMLKLKTSRNISLIQLDTAMFAYEPILLALQKMKSVPFRRELLAWKIDDQPVQLDLSPPLRRLVEQVTRFPSIDLRSLLSIPKSIVLDLSQAASLLTGLTQRVSLVQGPPGTGKSFIGALLAKCIHDLSTHTILVVCFTNHALDQFLEDLLDIGIPEESILRLGSKSTPRTESMNLYRKRMGQVDYKYIDSLHVESDVLQRSCQNDFDRYRSMTVSEAELLLHLEFNDKYQDFFAAFRVPTSQNGMTQVGKKGRSIDPHFLLRQWIQGKGPGFLLRHVESVKGAPQIWSMSAQARRDIRTQWEEEILGEQIEDFARSSLLYNECQDKISRKWGDRAISVMKSTRIVACTTTAAAMHCESLRAAPPEVLLVEEAGEILESHIVTSLGATTKQMILIGDHRQLRPKINNYLFSVEKGSGYELNRSLFERMVLSGYPHQTLSEQHRMRPEISRLIREMTYPDLVDAPSTKNRSTLRGVQSSVVFVDHDQLEDDDHLVGDSRDIPGSGWKSSKQNTYEVEMVLKMVRYLRQQEYPTDKIVVLTPYLGQLQRLQAAMKAHGGAVLNDMDSNELVKAGLLTPQTTKGFDKRLRLATIDNYQGEESDIVIVSLTRGNPSHDIGFMSSPERVNVLLSRARDALIIIGNSNTYTQSRKGGEMWKQLLDLLREQSYVYDGFPVQCSRHPHRTSSLKTPQSFEVDCPNGGCIELCALKLPCGIHTCPSKCHPHSEHQKMKCQHVIPHYCTAGHDQSYKCYETPPDKCSECEKIIIRHQDKLRRDLQAKEKQARDELAHERELADLDLKLAREAQKQADLRLQEERESVIQQKKRDVESAQRLTDTIAARGKSPVHANTPSPAVAPGSIPLPSAFFTAKKPTSSRSVASKPVLQVNSDAAITAASSTAGQAGEAQAAAVQSGPDAEWTRRKKMEGADDPAVDSIMEMIGLSEVKEKILQILDKIELSRRQGTSLKEERFNISFLGNPGTGKTTVARLYAKFLTSQGVLSGSVFKEVTGSSLANDGTPGAKKLLEEVKNGGGGAIFIDEAYQLVSQGLFGGSQVLDFLLAEMENNTGVFVFILAGYNKQMEKFFEHNPGIPSRIPNSLQFTDYTDAELRAMLEKRIHKKYHGRMSVQDGFSGLYMRIAIRRLGRGRGKEGFGNARALQNLFDRISDRQAKRISTERKSGTIPDDFWMSKEDLIGPDPSKALKESKATQELQHMIGLASVKATVSTLLDSIGKNYRRELAEQEPYQISLNRVFLGSPGTGKTSVAKLYGQILADLGLLSNGEVVIKNPSDFVGSALGQSEENTKNILASTIGKVLIIDEAYMLYGGGGGDVSQKGDPYKTAVIDTLVAEVQSTPGEDRCVLLLGYDEQMKEMFQKVNPGLSRRFAIENAFHFDDFDDDELLQILELKLKKQDLTATPAAKKTAIDVLARLRNRPNFGNGGEVENLLGKAKSSYIRRSATEDDAPLEPQDFDENFDRYLQATANLDALFADIVGCSDIIEKLRRYQKLAQVMKRNEQDPRGTIPMNFVFKGPPGTGKTTVARKIGQVYYDMGFLSSSEVKECSASDLVGQYVGQTGPKTKALFNEALGGVLFVDEAYRLAEGHFAQEAMDEIVGLLTQERYMHKIVVILAGYDHDMHKLLSVNSGLSSRFPEQFQFKHFSPDTCLDILRTQLRKQKVVLRCLEDKQSAAYMDMIEILGQLSTLDSWGNARDMGTLSKQIFSEAMLALSESTACGSNLASPTMKDDTAVAILRKMRDERIGRREQSARRGALLYSPPPSQPPTSSAPPPTAPRHECTIKTTQKQDSPTAEEKEEETQVPAPSSRDPGVSDAAWRQLQLDKKCAEDESRRANESYRHACDEAQRAAIQEQEVHRRVVAEKAAIEQQYNDFPDAAFREEARRRLEEELAREAAAKAERQRLEKLKKELEERKAREAALEEKKQQRLREIGVCPVGYRWIKQSGGYRCAGGSHWVSDQQIGL